ncbi:MAG: hypothetical protein ACI8Q3_002111, partial [Marinomonas primoryensis]
MPTNVQNKPAANALAQPKKLDIGRLLL